MWWWRWLPRLLGLEGLGELCNSMYIIPNCISNSYILCRLYSNILSI